MGTILCLALIVINALGALLTVIGAFAVIAWANTKDKGDLK